MLGKQKCSYHAEEVHCHLSDEHDQLLGVLLAIAHASVFLHGVGNSDSQANHEYDDENEQADLQVASDLAPHRQNHPDDDRNEQHAHSHVRHVLPLGTETEYTHRIANYVVEEERADQRTMINGQKYLHC